MAFLKLNFFSEVLGVGVAVNVILPESKRGVIGIDAVASESYKVLYLLHGLSDDETIWLRRTSIERYAAERGIAVVMPSAGRSWYTDGRRGHKFLSFIGEELPRVCQKLFRGMSDRREDNMIGGNSMGGYGAYKIALSYPERFSSAVSLSGAFDILGKSWCTDEEDWNAVFSEAFDSKDGLQGSEHDVFALAERAIEKGSVLPRLYAWCGTEDALISANRELDSHLTALGIEHTYLEGAGGHTWADWDREIRGALDFLV